MNKLGEKIQGFGGPAVPEVQKHYAAKAKKDRKKERIESGLLNKPEIGEDAAADAEAQRRRDSTVAHRQVSMLFEKFEKRFKEKAAHKEEFASALASAERKQKFAQEQADIDHNFLERVGNRRNESMTKMMVWTEQQKDLMTKIYNRRVAEVNEERLHPDGRRNSKLEGDEFSGYNYQSKQ